MTTSVGDIPIKDVGQNTDPYRMNWLEIFFTKHRDKIQWMHLLTFIIFMILLFVPLFMAESPENALPWNDFPVFANFVMWGLWFPLVFLSVIVTGRSWCGLFCPMGAASEQLNRIGFGFKTPDWIRWEGMPVVAFLVITMLGQTIGVRDHREAIALLFGGLTLIAIIVGLIYGKKSRVWCRHLCPIGLLLGLYSRLSIINFHPSKLKKGGDQYRARGVCPTMVDVKRKKESRHCIECFKCVDHGAEKTMTVSYRPAGQEVENIEEYNPNKYEVWFFFIGTGSALGGFLWLILPFYQNFRQTIGEWAINREWYWIGESGPGWLMSVHPERREVFNWLDFTSILTFMMIITVIFTVLMASINQLQTILVKRINPLSKEHSVFNILAYQYMPVAMISLLIGLGGKLFTLLEVLGLHPTLTIALKAGLFLAAILWSIKIGIRLVSKLGIVGGQLWLPVSVGATGSIAVGLSWWPAIFGL